MAYGSVDFSVLEGEVIKNVEDINKGEEIRFECAEHPL